MSHIEVPDHPAIGPDSTVEEILAAMQWYAKARRRRLAVGAAHYFGDGECKITSPHARTCLLDAGAIEALEAFIVRLDGTLEDEDADSSFNEEEALDGGGRIRLRGKQNQF